MPERRPLGLLSPLWLFVVLITSVLAAIFVFGLSHSQLPAARGGDATKPAIKYQADANATQKEPVPLDQAAGKMTPADGFKVSLVAGEPEVVQPIAMAFDDRGRLWVAEAMAYPVWAAQGHDRILIFEDTKGSGTFDKRSVFWDQGNYITGILPGFGGVWVTSTPNLLFFPLIDGEDKPSGPPQVVLDGWSTTGKHNVPNALTWGPDGWLYGCNGITSPSKVGAPGTPDNQRVEINCGVWRYHVQSKVFEAVCHGTTNPFGLDYDDYGQMFITNCVIAHLWQVIPGAHYQRMFGQDIDPHSYQLIESTSDHLHWGGGAWTSSRGGKGLHSVAGGGHAHSGAMIYLGDTWPEKYRNGIFMCNIHGNRINHDQLERQGAGYIGHHAPDFLMANDEWFRGDYLLGGPDDAMYVADWNDTGECHSTQVINRGTGRIFKVSYGDAKPTGRFDLNALDSAELAKLQTSKNEWRVRHARRILQERAIAQKDLSTAVKILHQTFATDADVRHKLRALWTLYSMGHADEAFLTKQLTHADAEVRGWAVRLLASPRNPGEVARKQFALMAKGDDHASVRLELASALQRMPAEQRWEIASGLVGHTEDIDDRNLPLMIWYGIEPAVASDQTRALKLAAECKIPLVRRLIAKRLIDVPDGSRDALVTLLNETNNVPLQIDLLSGMRDELSGRRNEKLPNGWDRLARRLADSSSATVQTEAEALSLIFGSPEAAASLRRKATDPHLDADQRRAALGLLVQQRVADLAPLLQSLLSDPALSGAAIRGLAAYDHPDTAEAIIKVYAKLDDAARRDAVETLASRKAYAPTLVKAIAAGTVPRIDVTAFNARQIRELKNKELMAQFEKAWGSLQESSADKKATIARYKTALTAEVLHAANLSNGRQIFSRTCQQCHTLYGVGGKVGPDITGGNRANLDYILENVVDPSAIVAKEYKLNIIRISDGRVISAIIREKRNKTLVVQTATEQLVLPLEEIEEQQESKVSMMPEGQLDRLSPDEVRDLIGYLATTHQVPLPGEKTSSAK